MPQEDRSPHPDRGMRQDRVAALFDDLEGQAAALWEADREAELADRSRREYARVTLGSRIAASVGRRLVMEVRGVGRVAGEADRYGEGWCLLCTDRQDWVVRASAVVALTGASERSLPEVAWSPVHRLGLGSPLRRLAESGERCVVHLETGATHEGVVLRVGEDFTELGTPTGTVLLPHAATAAVQVPRSG